MKRIIKEAEPAELLAWKNSDSEYLKGRPKWKRIPSNVKAIVRDNLKSEQGYLCCYCERHMQDNDYHIEHFAPKGIPPYDQRLADYDNLLCSCQFELEKGEPNHCGNSKASWYDPDLLVSPLDPSCEARFRYTYDGQIKPAIDTDIAAETTIIKLQLHIDKLNALRQAAIIPFLDEDLTPEDISDFAEGYLVDKGLNGGRFNEFYTTIKFLFG